MKLRIRGKSLRLRLLRSEVERFGETGRISETVRFGASPEEQMIYSLEVEREISEIEASFKENRIVVKVPFEAARNWLESDEISLRVERLIKDENTLKILIEKDFVCLDRKNDPNNLDAFPHPTGKCG